MRRDIHLAGRDISMRLWTNAMILCSEVRNQARRVIRLLLSMMTDDFERKLEEIMKAESAMESTTNQELVGLLHSLISRKLILR